MKNKISIIIGVILTLGFAGAAQAVTVDGNFGLAEWAGNYSNDDGVGTHGYVGPGYGGQAFDVELLGLEFTPGGELYFGLQTGFDFRDTVWYGGAPYHAGDFALDVNGDGFYDYAIDFSFTGDTPTFSLWDVSVWDDVAYTAYYVSQPFQKGTATPVAATFTGAYGSMDTSTYGGVSYTLEGSVNLSALALYSSGPITLHWTMSCGNDYLNHTSKPTSVPEPGTLLLLGSGLVGLAWKVRRKKTS
ncbi:MAG: hypothetical protein BMS9Abin24_202 [Thermodesulfobacteriota bacterium]|nr:MAG: hypothetical protein BMS9Abin24_202 [Thermodesulfobacteriota bacterium]